MVVQQRKRALVFWGTVVVTREQVVQVGMGVGLGTPPYTYYTSEQTETDLNTLVVSQPARRRYGS